MKARNNMHSNVLIRDFERLTDFHTVEAKHDCHCNRWDKMQGLLTVVGAWVGDTVITLLDEADNGS